MQFCSTAIVQFIINYILHCQIMIKFTTTHSFTWQYSTYFYIAKVILNELGKEKIWKIWQIIKKY